MIKKLVYIFIPVLAVLFMSHNVSAVSLTYDLSNYSRVKNINSIGKFDCGVGSNYSNMTVTTAWSCSLPPNKGIYTFRSNGTISLNENDLVLLDVVVLSNGNISDDIIKFNVQNGFTDSNLRFVGLNEITGSEFYHLSQAFYNSNGYQSFLNQGYTISKLYELVFIAGTTDSYHIGFLGSNSVPFVSYSTYSTTSNTSLVIRPDFVGVFRKDKSQVNKEQEQATQDASNNSATSGNSSSTNSQTATSSLLSVITSGIGAITSASPTNCKINGNMGNLNVGNIDLCANPVPTFMSLIGSIIAVLVVLPLVILLFNRFISIIRSFQR